jgi:hypothetical protein
MEASRQKNNHVFFQGNMLISSETCVYNKDYFLNDLLNVLTELNFSARAICHPLFQILVARLNPLCIPDIPNKNNIRLLIKDRYLKGMTLIDNEIASVNGRVTLLIDEWTSQNLKGYIAILILIYLTPKMVRKLIQNCYNLYRLYLTQVRKFLKI